MRISDEFRNQDYLDKHTILLITITKIGKIRISELI